MFTKRQTQIARERKCLILVSYFRAHNIKTKIMKMIFILPDLLLHARYTRPDVSFLSFLSYTYIIIWRIENNMREIDFYLILTWILYIDVFYLDIWMFSVFQKMCSNREKLSGWLLRAVKIVRYYQHNANRPISGAGKKLQDFDSI